ncbi:MAG: translocation/assembly module TamB domain-containing protein [Maritimibacter sp.]|nr:translocation/assembly module TamB domain-containing protein [Maritimibacter sp.]
MTRLAPLLAATFFAVLPAFAQDGGADAAEDDKSILENFLQDNLSAAGRTVEVTGFSGALSSQATMQRLTVADDEGVWLTIENAELNWTRSALLRGRLEIDALTAERIEVVRAPVAVSDGPQPATSDFALPELPVSINIGEISAAQLVLGEPLLGMPVEMSLQGGGQLEDGAGEAAVTLERIDGQTGRFSLAAAYANDTGVLALDLDLDEGRDGIVATLTGLPGSAPLAFTLKGTGPIDDYTADLALATDGANRIGGQVTLDRTDPAGPMAFTAKLQGDPTALLAPDFHDFFGDDVQLAVEGQRAPDGQLDLSTLDIAADALTLSGEAVIAPGGWPERALLSGTLASPNGRAVRLPLGGDPTWVDRAELSFDYDAARGDDWRAEITLDTFSRPDVRIGRAALVADGTLTPGGNGTPPAFGGHVELTATRLGGPPDSPAEALGPDLTGSFDLGRTSGDVLAFTNLDLGGSDYRLTGLVTLDTVVEKLDLVAEGAVTLSANDLSRFAALSGQALTGAARLDIAGNAALPGGPFDVDITGSGRDLGVGIPEADRLFAGASTLAISAARTAEGTEIDRFDIRAPGASATGTGWLAADASQLALRLDLPDAALLADGLDGPLSAQATALQRGRDWDIALDATGPGGAQVKLTGLAETRKRGLIRVSGDVSGGIDRLAAWSGLARRDISGSARFTASGEFEPEDGRFSLTGTADGQDLDFGLGTADRLTAGASTASFEIRRNRNGVYIVDQFSLETPELSLNANGRAADEMPRITFDGRLRDLGPFVPGLPGALTASGTANLTDTGWRVKLTGDGPGGTALDVSGNVAGDVQSADLALRGRAPLAMVNGMIAPRALSGMAAFDLRLDGPLELGSLSGRITTDGARAALPTVGISLDPLDATVRLASGQADVDVNAKVSSGGRIAVRGPVALTAPYLGTLSIDAQNVHLQDPTLYDLTLNGNLVDVRPARRRRLDHRRGAARQPSSFRSPRPASARAAASTGSDMSARPPRCAPRSRAPTWGTGGSSGSGGGGAAYGLGITISAPSAVFIRGRGLDAELGGTLTVGGTTQNVITTGGVTLIRGRLDILGNRLALTEGSATLRGSLDPTLNLRAETTAADTAIQIAVEGLASNPTVTFSSSPDLPEDEILARLVFGRGLDQISAFQAVKLASAIATLSGKGGAGTISKLREGFGLDDLDVTTGEDGGLEVSAGTYISDNVYTDVTVGADGRAEVNLNLTLTPSLTARGSVGSDGSTGIGVYFEKDY